MLTTTHATASPRPGRRADAERNRAAIIEAAGEVFAGCGGGVDVREIARRSGVGMGTLYRHFSTKDELLATVLEQQFNAWGLTDAHQQAVANQDPWQALVGFFEQLLDNQAGNRAVVENYAATGGPSAACVQRCYSIRLGSLRGEAMETAKPQCPREHRICIRAGPGGGGQGRGMSW